MPQTWPSSFAGFEPESRETWWTNAVRACTLPRPMVRTTVHAFVPMPVPAGITAWYKGDAGVRLQARINQPSGY